MDKNERKRLKREGRKLVEENSRRIHAEIAARTAENTAPLYSDEWMRVAVQHAREDAAKAQAEREARAAEIARLLDRELNDPTPPPSKVFADRAVQLAGRHGQIECGEILAQEFSHISNDPNAPEFAAAYSRAEALFSEAEVVAEESRNSQRGDGYFLKLLEERFPGHEARIYVFALGVGYSRTR